MTEERKGALGDHERRGREYIPKMRQLPLTLTDNFRDECPDFIWPSLLWIIGGDELVLKLVEVQKALAQRISGKEPRFDGRLSTLEIWTPLEREELAPIVVAEVQRYALFPPQLEAVLDLYSDVPACWLFKQLSQGPTKPFDRSELLLLDARAVAEWGRGGHLEALTKYLMFCWGALTKSMGFDSITIDHLHDYPRNPAKLSAAESIIRAGHGAHRGMATEYELTAQDVALNWARTFWNQNWNLSGCLPEHGADDAEQVDLQAVDGNLIAPEDVTERKLVIDFASELSTMIDEFLEQFDAARSLDLYDPLPSEVISGLVMRAIDAVAAVVRAPHQWSGQFGASALRQMAETEIVFGRFAAHPDDFLKYRDYGLGHEKLTWLHVEDFLAGLPDIPTGLEKVAAEVEKRKQAAPVLDTTIVNVGPTFNGISLRAMAQEVGLADLYRSVFQASSTEIHGEWEPVQRENLMRCLNPLHRFHMIPSTEPPWIHDPTFPRMLIGMLRRLVNIGIKYLEI